MSVKIVDLTSIDKKVIIKSGMLLDARDGTGPILVLSVRDVTSNTFEGVYLQTLRHSPSFSTEYSWTLFDGKVIIKND